MSGSSFTCDCDSEMESASTDTDSQRGCNAIGILSSSDDGEGDNLSYWERDFLENYNEIFEMFEKLTGGSKSSFAIFTKNVVFLNMFHLRCFTKKYIIVSAP